MYSTHRIVPATLLAAVVAALVGSCHRPRGGEPLTWEAAAGEARGLPSVDPGLSDRPLYTFDESEIDRYVCALHAAEPDPIRRVVTLGRKNIGQPYEIYLLGEFPFELHDPDPIYCLSRSDCLTFCEHTYAMALASDWWSFLRTLQRIRYRDGVIGMLTRNHHTIADWNRNNAFLFDDLTARLGHGEAWAPFAQVCRRARFFARFGIGQDIPDEPITDAYVPTGNVSSILAELRDGDFVNVIRGNAESQWAGHTGMIAIGDDGAVNLLHSARPAVREQPLLDYLRSDRRCVGIKILRLRPDAEDIMRRTLQSSAQATDVGESSLASALHRRREAAPATARPPAFGWRRAMRLQSYRLDHDTAAEPELQAMLDEIDGRLGAQFGIPDDERAIGVLDLTDLRLATVRPDEMFYAASVPKVCILLAYFETHPEAAAGLPADVRRELGRMIKVSDNQLAAKYGRLVGMDKVQRIIQSKRYRFYDPQRSGGLWYGKHCSEGRPRVGDPLHDHSHGATVRQCLRFYLMLEQGRLVSPAACTRMKEIFASPELELSDSKFARGLQERDLTLIRKSGTWKDWHLDTARVEHGDRVYLLAGITHHPNGAEYLAAAAAAIDDYLCGPPTPKPFSHQLLFHETAEDFGRGTARPGEICVGAGGVILRCACSSSESDEPAVAVYESPVVDTDTRFNEVVISWNVDAPPNVGFCVEARVGRRYDGSWSPYLYFADWGDVLPPGERSTQCDDGWIDVDYFASEQRFDRVQYRLRAVCRTLRDGGACGATLRIARIAVCLSDTTGRVTSVPAPARSTRPKAAKWQRRLPVPFRSQRAEHAELAGRICSPTSVSMMLEHRGVTRPTEEVARRIYDAGHDIYGNWPRAVQTAYSYGVPGYLTRFSDWTGVERMIANDQPLIISIRVEEGELTGAPYTSTDGHLLVLAGFDAEGNVEVNDPAAQAPEEGQVTYSRRDLETVWMRGKGGTAYVLLPLPGAEPPPMRAEGPAEEPLVDFALIDPRIVIDLRYATADNFTGRRLYPVARCLLRESVARRLRRVQDRLVRQGRGLKVYDAYRPLSVQRKMWETMPDPDYVADPAKGSRHNRGAAVDVTLIDAEGRELEMPTGYDDFTPAAHRDYRGGTDVSRRNRDLLISAMEAEGFTGLRTEWWHFDAPGWQQYPLLNVPLDGAPESSLIHRQKRWINEDSDSARHHGDEGVGNVAKNGERRLVRIDVGDQLAVERVEHGHGLGFVDLDPLADHAFVGIVGTVGLERPALEAVHQHITVRDAQVNHRQDLDQLDEQLDLAGGSRDAVQEKNVVVRAIRALRGQPFYVPLPDPHGQLVGHQQAFGRIG